MTPTSASAAKLGETDAVSPPTTFPPRALRVLRCPQCGGSLELNTTGLRCASEHVAPFVAPGVPDLVGTVAQADSTGQFFMRFGPLVRVYERLWRPLFTAAVGGRNPDTETALLAEWLEVGPSGVILDVACGPGNTTRRLARAVPDGGALGVDFSTPMLEEAANARTGAGSGWTAYARADAHHLSLGSASVDGVHCAAALYLMSDPAQVVRELARVLRPGGVFAGMTIAAKVHLRLPVTERVTGLRYVSPAELVQMCEDAGLVDAATEHRGGALLFRARRPTES